MTLLTLILMISAIALLSFSYLKVLYEAKRKIKIITVETVKTATGQQTQQNTVTEYPQAPGPAWIWPMIGNLIELGKHASPSIAFTELAKKYGDIYSMTLGSTRCLVVNNLNVIREVLNQNGKSFGARPDFLRFHKLFGGDRANCKYSMYNFFSFLIIHFAVEQSTGVICDQFWHENWLTRYRYNLCNWSQNKIELVSLNWYAGKFSRTSTDYVLLLNNPSDLCVFSSVLFHLITHSSTDRENRATNCKMVNFLRNQSNRNTFRIICACTCYLQTAHKPYTLRKRTKAPRALFFFALHKCV